MGARQAVLRPGYVATQQNALISAQNMCAEKGILTRRVSAALTV